MWVVVGASARSIDHYDRTNYGARKINEKKKKNWAKLRKPFRIQNPAVHQRHRLIILHGDYEGLIDSQNYVIIYFLFHVFYTYSEIYSTHGIRRANEIDEICSRHDPWWIKEERKKMWETRRHYQDIPRLIDVKKMWRWWCLQNKNKKKRRKLKLRCIV